MLTTFGHDCQHVHEATLTKLEASHAMLLAHSWDRKTLPNFASKLGTVMCITKASWHNAMAGHLLKSHVMECETRILSFQGAMQTLKKPAQPEAQEQWSFVFVCSRSQIE